MKTALVVTTIHDCTRLLAGYLANFAKYGRKVDVYVIPDIKTPPFTATGAMIFDLGTQDGFLKEVGYPPDEIPRNSDNRRNVGYLMALANGAEVVISIDDDNYVVEDEDFAGEHALNLTRCSRFSVSTESNWYNDLLLHTVDRNVFPRGFPYYAREPFRPSTLQDNTLITMINAGMWNGDPDLDAMTWIHNPARTSHGAGSVTLAMETWCPINSQNTAVARDLMPAYWFVRMDPPNDRFGDIFQGYFALKVAKTMGWTARFGSPFVQHKRNEHVYLKDVAKEIGPILALEELLPRLLEVKLQGTTVNDIYLDLANWIRSQDTPFYARMAERMRLWADACGRIG